MENLFQFADIDLLTVPATKTGTVTSSVCDTEGYRGVMFLAVYGASGDTLSSSVKIDGKLQSCATQGGTYADVATGDVLGSTANAFASIDAATEDEAVYALCYNGSNRYVKVVLTFTGTHTNGIPIAILAVKKLPRVVTTEQAVNP